MKNEFGRYLAVNQIAQFTLGIPGNEIIGSDDFDLFNHSSAMKMQERDDYILKSKSLLCYDSTAQIIDDEKPIDFVSVKAPRSPNSPFGRGLIGLSIKKDEFEYPADMRALMYALMSHRAAGLEKIF